MTKTKVPTSLFPAAAAATPASPERAGFSWTSSVVWLASALLVALPLCAGPFAAATASPFQYPKWLLLGAGSALMAVVGAVALLTDPEARARVLRLVALPPVWGALLFAAAFAAATLLAADPAVAGSVAWMVLGPLGAALALAFSAGSPRALCRLRVALVVAGVAVAVVGLGDSFGLLPLFTWVYGKTPEEMLRERGPEFLRAMVGGVWGRGRLIATIGNPAYVGGFLIVATLLLSIGLLELFTNREAKHRLRRAVLHAAGLALCGATLLLTSTREAFLGIFAGLGVWVLLQPRIEDFLRRAWMLLAGLAVILAVVVAIFSTSNSLNVFGWNVAGRFAELRDLRSESVRERLIFYSVAGELFSARPALGWGPGMYGVRFYPTLQERMDSGATGAWELWIGKLAGRASENTHNDLFQFAVECGAIGLGAFLWLLAGILATGWATVRARFTTDAADGARGATFLATWVGASIPLLTSFPLRTPERAFTWWMLAAATLAWIAAARHAHTNDTASES